LNSINLKRALVDGQHGRLMDEAYVGAVAKEIEYALNLQWNNKILTHILK
jgi:hypothetical protein